MLAVGAERRAEVPLSLWMAGLTSSFPSRGRDGPDHGSDAVGLAPEPAPLRRQVLLPLRSEGCQLKLQEPCAFIGFSGRR